MTGSAARVDEQAERLARYYDLDFLDVSYDAELYQQLAHETGGPVLEMGVGSGRLGIPLALAGHEVVGIDLEPAMLERARARWQQLRGDAVPGRLLLERADFAAFRSSRRFGLVLMAVNTFLLAANDVERKAILATMRRHLRRDGVAAIEVGTPDEAELDRYDRRLQLEWLREDPETGEEVSKTISAHHDPDEGTLELTQVYEWTPRGGGPLGRVTTRDVLHLLPAHRLRELALEAGFASADLWGDHLLTPHGAGSHRAILVARLV